MTQRESTNTMHGAGPPSGGRPRSRLGWPVLLLLLLTVALAAAACGGDDADDPGSIADAGGPDSIADAGDPGSIADAGGPDSIADAGDPGSITVYSGRNESLIGPLIEQFEADTGIDVRVRYGGTAALAVALLEEGGRTPADVFLAQDAGALGALEEAGLFAALSPDILARVDPVFRSAGDAWVGVSGRARVIVYSTERLAAADLPDSIFDLTAPVWRGRVGWAPTNGSFQAFITAMRRIHGEERTAQWLRAMLDNGVKEFPKNTPIVQAVADDQIDLGLVNHYYLFRFLAEDPDFPAANAYTDPGDAGALINIAGAGLLAPAADNAAARRFIAYLLETPAQTFFSQETNEYPLIDGLDPRPGIPTLDTLSPPSLRLTSLSDLEGTLDLLRDTGALP